MSINICVIKDENKNPTAIINKLKSRSKKYKIHAVSSDEVIDDKIYDVIIPVGIRNTRSSTKYSNSLFSDSKLIKYLDDKVRVNNYINSEIIPFIPTLNLKHASELDIKKFVEENNTFSRFLYKPRNMQGGYGQKIHNKDKIKLNDKNKKKGILQPYFETVIIYATELVACNGNIISLIHTEEFKSHINPNNKTDLDTYVYPVLDESNVFYSRMDEFAKDLIRRHNYSGIMEIEYLINDNNIYFIEINPRISGMVRSDYYIINGIQTNKNQYIDRILIPYIDAVKNKKN